MRNRTAELIRTVSMMLMGISVLFGVLFLITNFGYLQTYAESGELMDMSSSFLLDEYTGILYPLLLALCRMAAQITTIPVVVWAQILQLIIAGISAYVMAGALLGAGNPPAKVLPCGGKQTASRLLLTAFFILQPQILQMHLAVLPYSLDLSAWMWILTGMMHLAAQRSPQALQRTPKTLQRTPKTLQRTQDMQTQPKEQTLRTAFLQIGIAYVAAALLVPDSLWIGAIVLGLFGIWMLRQKEYRKRRVLYFGVLLAAMAVTLSVRALTVTPGAYGRTQDSFGSAMVSRFVWPNFATNYYFWSDEIKAVISEEEAVYLCEREDALKEDLGALVESAYGREHANALYLEMAWECLTDRTKEIGIEIGRDAKDYLLLPATIVRNLLGMGTSMTAQHYAKMREHTPALAAVFVRLMPFVQLVLLLCAALHIVCTGRRLKAHSGILLLVLLTETIWLTMRSNYPVDWKQGLVILLIWQVLAAGAMSSTEAEQERNI